MRNEVFPRDGGGDTSTLQFPATLESSAPRAGYSQPLLDRIIRNSIISFVVKATHRVATIFDC